jgi:hypothetical protein
MLTQSSYHNTRGRSDPYSDRHNPSPVPDSGPIRGDAALRPLCQRMLQQSDWIELMHNRIVPIAIRLSAAGSFAVAAVLIDAFEDSPTEKVWLRNR